MSAAMLPMRDGFRFTPRGLCGSASRSAIEWMGSSHVTRSQCPSSTAWSGLLGRVLDPGIGEALDDPAVQRGVGRLVDHRADVQALEVDGVDRTGARERPAEVVVPGVRGVELESERRVRASRSFSGSIVAGSPSRSETTNVTGRHARPTACSRGSARLAQGQVEGRALEGPATVVPVAGISIPSGKRSKEPTRSEKPSSVQSPARSRIGPAAWKASCSSAEYVTSSPTPSVPPPRSRIRVDTRSKPLDTFRRRASRWYPSIRAAGRRGLAGASRPGAYAVLRNTRMPLKPPS